MNKVNEKGSGEIEEELISKDFQWGDDTPKVIDFTDPEHINNMLNPPPPKIDRELPLFFGEWLRNGRNATLAYKKLHPNVSDASARVLGCRILKRLNVPQILASFGFGVDTYMELLDKGLKAKTKNKITGEMEDDLRTQRIFHQALGKLLKLE